MINPIYEIYINDKNEQYLNVHTHNPLKCWLTKKEFVQLKNMDNPHDNIVIPKEDLEKNYTLKKHSSN